MQSQKSVDFWNSILLYPFSQILVIKLQLDMRGAKVAVAQQLLYAP